MFVAGVDGCRAGWVCFRVELPSKVTGVEVIDLSAWLRHRPDGLAAMAIDIPIGLFDRPRSCDMEARKLLGQPRGSSVFPPPCREATRARTYEDACTSNHSRTGRKISRQVWGIAIKIREVDEAMTPDVQAWAVEVHPEICFYAMNGGSAMRHGKKTSHGQAERQGLLRTVFHGIDRDLANRPSGVGIDDLLDSAAAAWTALRCTEGRAECVCEPEIDLRGLAATIWY